jgi:hypothetical protein
VFSTNSSNFKITNYSGTDLLSISNTGAATFSSSVTANGGVRTTGANGYSDTDGSSTIFVIANISGSVPAVAVTTNHPLAFYTNNTEKMRITSGGNVGIGTSSPSQLLEVYKSQNASTNLLVRNDNAGASAEAYMNVSNGTYLTAIGTRGTGTAAYNSLDTNSGMLNYNGNTSLTINATDASAVIKFTTNNFTERMRITSGGFLLVGTTTNSGFGSVNRICRTIGESNAILSIDGGSANDFSTLFRSVAGGNFSTAEAAQWVGRNTSTLRSINAGGTVNASGTDYAEYMTKAIEDNIAKGDIVGINQNGLLTNIFADAKSFVIKSTDPSYVGGDTWGVKLEGEELEAARAKVDRIAFSGQVPCNVYNAQVGDYIIPIELDGKISGQAVSNPTFEQYQLSVGKVWKIMEDGRAWIAVKIG